MLKINKTSFFFAKKYNNSKHLKSKLSFKKKTKVVNNNDK